MLVEGISKLILKESLVNCVALSAITSSLESVILVMLSRLL